MNQSNIRHRRQVISPRLVRRRLTAAVAATTLGICSVARIAAGGTYVWNNNGSDFTAAANWSPSGGPTSNDQALFDPESSPPGTAVVNPTVNGSLGVLSLTIAPSQNLSGWTFGGTGTLNVGGAGSTGLTTYGPQTTTFNGPSLAGPDPSDTVALNVTTGSTLVLAGNSTAYTNPGPVTVNGGTLVLDNTNISTSTRINDTGTVMVTAGGTLRLVGNSDYAVQESVGLLSTGSNTISGVNTFEIDPNGAGAEIDFTNNITGTATTFTTRPGSRAVYRFVTTSGSLGDPNGAIFNFISGAAPTLTYCGMLGNAVNTGGYAVTTDASGTNFATYDPVLGIIPLTESDVFSDPANDHSVLDAGGLSLSTVMRGAVGGVNGVGGSVQLNLDASATPLSATSQWNMGALRVTVTGSSGTLNMGSNGLAACGLMLDGTGDLYINGTGMLGADGTRYLWVNNPNASLYIGLNILGTGSYPSGKTASNNPTVICGPGFVVLTGTGIQGTDDDTTRLSIAGGVLRANNAQLGFTSNAKLGVISFGGGVLEIANGTNGTGASADFTRSLGVLEGDVDFGAGTGAEQGGGGFSAYGSAASVNINGLATPTTLQWNSTAFVPDGDPLIFGSSKSNAVLTFLNPIQLDNGSAPCQLREIRVNGGTGGDKTILAGVISGASDADLIKTGTGLLQLSQSNTYTGNTLVGQGQMIVSGSIASPMVVVSSGANLTLASSIALPADAVVQDSGTVNFTSANTTSGNTTGSPAPVIFSALNITSGAEATVDNPSLHANREILTLTSLSLAGKSGAWTGKLDLSGNDLVIQTTDSITASQTLRTTFDQLKSGYARGTWNASSGIVSSAAAADPSHLTTLGVATGLNSFDGNPVSPTDVLVKYTYYGDANLDGTVDGSDYSQIDNGFLTHATGWANGDFNYDGVVNGSDYTLIDNAFNNQAASLAEVVDPAAVATAIAAPPSSVPEPVGMAAMLALTAALPGRRKPNSLTRFI